MPIPEEQASAKRDVGFVSEDMRLHGNVTLAWYMKFVASIYPGWDPAYADVLLRRFNLHADQDIKALSHGERVKAMLTSWFWRGVHACCCSTSPRPVSIPWPGTRSSPS